MGIYTLRIVNRISLSLSFQLMTVSYEWLTLSSCSFQSISIHIMRTIYKNVIAMNCWLLLISIYEFDSENYFYLFPLHCVLFKTDKSRKINFFFSFHFTFSSILKRLIFCYLGNLLCFALFFSFAENPLEKYFIRIN